MNKQEEKISQQEKIKQRQIFQNYEIKTFKQLIIKYIQDVFQSKRRSKHNENENEEF